MVVNARDTKPSEFVYATDVCEGLTSLMESCLSRLRGGQKSNVPAVAAQGRKWSMLRGLDCGPGDAFVTQIGKVRGRSCDVTRERCASSLATAASSPQVRGQRDSKPVLTLSSAPAVDFDFVVEKTKSKRAVCKRQSRNALVKTPDRLDNVFS